MSTSIALGGNGSIAGMVARKRNPFDTGERYDLAKLQEIYGEGSILRIYGKQGEAQLFLPKKIPMFGPASFNVTAGESDPQEEAQAAGPRSPAHPAAALGGLFQRSIAARMRARGRANTLLTGLGG